jgi:integrase
MASIEKRTRNGQARWYPHRPFVLTLAGLGLRVREAGGLRIIDVDLLRSANRIRQQRRPGGDMGQPTTGSSGRDLPADATVLNALAAQVKCRPRRDGLIFGSTIGRALSKSIACHLFDDIEGRVGSTVSPNSLRRYFGASRMTGAQ